MKDIIITSRRQKTELWFAAGAFVVANILNIYAIATYGAPAKEVFTSIFYVLAFTAVLYAFSVIVRLLIYSTTRLFKKKPKKH